MTLLAFPTYDLQNESDVEQKFLFPFLNHPSFLGVPSRSILTKASLGRLDFIKKSNLSKDYIPDYVIFVSGFPVLVVEAKAPDVSAELALREARLYSQALNEHFPTGVNPVSWVVGSNGIDFLFGRSDEASHQKVSCSDLVAGSATLHRVRDLIGWSQLSEITRTFDGVLRGKSLARPMQRLRPQLFVERVQPNALAPYLNQISEMFFRAEEPEKIQTILEKAYVDTAELREYDQIIHLMLKQIERSSENPLQTIQTDKKREYTLMPELNRYASDIGNHGKLNLIIGSRGAGKSLFISRFFAHLMPDDFRRNAVWCVIDFNKAPSSALNIQEFICEKFIERIENVGFDIFDIDGMQRIFSIEINRLKRGALALIKDEAERSRLLAAELLRLGQDRRAFALGLARHLVGEAGRPLIVAFDNVDRRESSQQLQIFQDAQWFRNETRAFALLTLRDETFERYKREPPLDTYAQTSNFYIRPPRFSLVLQKRLNLAIEEGLKDVQEIEQPTASGIRFRYNKQHLATFLRAVYDAIFLGQNQIGRIVDALAERDVRDALGMFARIISSGHFNADRIIGIGLGSPAKIENDQLIKILMRADYRLYSDRVGVITNLLWLPQRQHSGNIFLMSEVLGFFAQQGEAGADKIAGYWRLNEAVADLSSMGFLNSEIAEAIQEALRLKLLTYDGEELEVPTEDDLIKITPGGFIHLRSMPYFIEYVASISLECSISDPVVVRKISEKWSMVERTGDLTFPLKFDVVEIFSEYMVREKLRLDQANPIFKARSREAENIVKALTGMVNQFRPVVDKIRARSRSRVRPR